MNLFGNRKEQKASKSNVSWTAINLESGIVQNCSREWCDTERDVTQLIIDLAIRFFSPNDLLSLCYDYKEIRIQKVDADRDTDIWVKIFLDNLMPERSYWGGGSYKQEEISYENLPMLLKKMEYWTYPEFCRRFHVSEEFFDHRSMGTISSLHIVIPKDESWIKGEAITQVEAFNAGVKYLIENPDVYAFEFGRS